jgi:hypothetical protein
LKTLGLDRKMNCTDNLHTDHCGQSKPLQISRNDFLPSVQPSRVLFRHLEFDRGEADHFCSSEMIYDDVEPSFGFAIDVVLREAPLIDVLDGLERFSNAKGPRSTGRILQSGYRVAAYRTFRRGWILGRSFK